MNILIAIEDDGKWHVHFDSLENLENVHVGINNGWARNLDWPWAKCLVTFPQLVYFCELIYSKIEVNIDTSPLGNGKMLKSSRFFIWKNALFLGLSFKYGQNASQKTSNMAKMLHKKLVETQQSPTPNPKERSSLNKLSPIGLCTCESYAHVGRLFRICEYF